MALADQRHRLAQQRLATAVQTALTGMLLGLQDPGTDEAATAYATAAARYVGGGQRRSAQLAIGYLNVLSPPPAGAQPASVDRALHGTLVGLDSPVATSPLLRLLARLADGDEELVARQAAGSYAGALATGDMQAAQRGGLAEGARVGGRKVRGWRKELSADPCEWCINIASGGGRYRHPDTVPFHQRDHCGVAPVFADQEE